MHEGHRQRMKNRFTREGLDNFEAHQVLELLLFYSIPRKDTNELAHRLLDKYGSLAGVFEADQNDLMQQCGLSENTAVLLALIPQLSRVYYKDKWGHKPVLDSSSKAGEFVTKLLIGRNYEVFYVICLDAQNRVNVAELVHEGTINQAPIYPRIIVETALRHHASSVILAHNHPGGSLTPSNADIEATNKIKLSLETISIKVIDHIITAGDSYYSFAEKDML